MLRFPPSAEGLSKYGMPLLFRLAALQVWNPQLAQPVFITVVPAMTGETASKAPTRATPNLLMLIKSLCSPRLNLKGVSLYRDYGYNSKRPMNWTYPDVRV